MDPPKCDELDCIHYLVAAQKVFSFWDVVNGSHAITPWWPAVNPAAANPATNGAVGLPAVPAGEVRGTT